MVNLLVNPQGKGKFMSIHGGFVGDFAEWPILRILRLYEWVETPTTQLSFFVVI